MLIDRAQKSYNNDNGVYCHSFTARELFLQTE